MCAPAVLAWTSYQETDATVVVHERDNIFDDKAELGRMLS